MKDWLTASEQGFTDVCRKWLEVGKKTNVSTLYGWDGEKFQDVVKKIMIFLGAREAFVNVDSSINRKAKQAAQKEAASAMRVFANTSVRYNPLMDEIARSEMGIRTKDSTLTSAPRPTIRPETVVENTTNRLEHKIKAISGDTRSTSKPAEAYGVRFAWQVGGTKPASGEDLPKNKFSRRAYLIATYSETDKGKTVYYATCYENTKGEAGPWSLLEEAFIG
ncbi:MAG: hypothetical protein LBV41_00830 [Cytophagaceae bacterium]|jgi:hypothetical protein|nr:hypothetical protein [Cytophagaceae bacterium]